MKAQLERWKDNFSLDEYGWIPIAWINLILTFTLNPHPVFQKYPVLAALLKNNQLEGDSAASPSPFYLLLNCLFSAHAIHFIQAAVGCCLIQGVFNFGARMGGTWLGWAAALLLGFSRPFLNYEGILEPDFLLMVSLFWGVQLSWYSKSTKGRILAFALLGISVSLRPLVLPSVCAVLVFLAFRKNSGLTKKNWALLLTLFTLVAITPSCILFFQTKASISHTMGGDTALYEGSRPEGNGEGVQAPFILKLYEKQVSPKEVIPDFAHELYRRFARSIHPANEKDSSIASRESISPSNYWILLWREYLHLHPWSFLKLEIRKLAIALTGSEFFDLKESRLNEIQWKNLGWLLGEKEIFCLGLLGFFTYASLGIIPLFNCGVFLVLIITLIGFSITHRYLIVLLPFEALFAASNLALIINFKKNTLKREKSEKERPNTASLGSLKKPLLTFSLGCVLLLTLLHSEPVRESHRWNLRLQAAALNWANIAQSSTTASPQDRQDRFVESQADFPFGEWEADFRMLPFDSPTLAREAAVLSQNKWGLTGTVDRIFLAQLYEMANDCNRVLELAQSLIETSFIPSYHDTTFDPRLMAARCALKMGKPAKAWSWIERSLGALPGNANALALGYALARTAPQSILPMDSHFPTTTVSTQLIKELQALHDPISSGFLLAQSFFFLNDLEQAATHIKQVMELLPDFGLFEHTYALILAKQGRGLEASRYLNLAITHFPQLNYRVSSLNDEFKNLSEKYPKNTEIAQARIRQLARQGSLQEAHQLTQKWLSNAFMSPNLNESDSNIFKNMNESIENALNPPLQPDTQRIF